MSNILFQIDCQEYMKDIPDNHFDLSIVDVPYGIGEDKEDLSRSFQSDGKARINKKWNNPTPKNYHKKDWDNKPPEQEYFNELFRISKNQIIWGANHFVSKIPFDSSGWIFWDKKNGNSDFSDGELAWTSFNKGLRKFEWLWNGFQKQKPETRIHVTQKPIALYKWLLTNYAKPGDKLFDSHSGSGSFRIAAYDMGFDLVSCELDADYCRDNEARFQDHIKQIDLFKPKELQKNIYQKELL